MKRNQLAMKINGADGADVEQILRQIVAETLGIDESLIHAWTDFRDDLGADSLDLVQLIMAFGRVFDAEICDEKVRNIRTIGEAVAYLEQNLHPAEVEQEEAVASAESSG